MKFYSKLSFLVFLIFVLVSSCQKDEEKNPDVDYIEYRDSRGDIGKGGGKIIVEDQNSEMYGVGVHIPQGAINQITNISFSKAEDIVSPTDSLATVINMQPSGLTFNKPIKIYLPFKGTSEPKVYYYNSDSSYLELLEVTSYDDLKGIVEAETDHFSDFFAGEDGVYVDAELFYINNKVRSQIQFGGYYRGTRMWTGGIDLRWAPFLFGGLQYWNALGFLESANPIGTYNNHCYVTFEIELRRLKTIGSELIEKETYAIQRIGSEKGKYSAIVYKLSGSGSFEQIYETEILTRDELDIYFSGKALAIDFESSINSTEEYFIETSWVLSDNVNGIGGIMGHRWTDKYYISTRKQDDGVWDLSRMNKADQDKDKNGIVDEFEKEKGDPPVADFIASYTSISENGIIDFTDLSKNNPTTWAWDFGNGGISSEQNPSYSYNAYGTYTVSLVAGNNYGSDKEIKKDYIIVVRDGRAPSASFTASKTAITEGKSIQFTDQSTNDPTSWTWDFGDGNSSYQQNPSHTYSSAGTYTVKLTVSNSFGSDSETKTNYITVNAAGSAPIAAFSASSTNITEGESIQFTDQSTNGPTTWAWDFGEGSTSSQQNPSHSYNSAGTYTVSLTVYNVFGSDTETKTDFIIVNSGNVEKGDLVFNPNLTYGTVTDIDGNTYKTIQIGEQEWMAQNLATTKYNDGTAIPLETSNSVWSNLSTPAYCWYNNDEATNKANYGALYNWYVIETNKLCPTGWHVPTDAEWKELEMYLGMNQSEADGYGGRGTDEGGKLKETGTTHWNSPNTGATNESGFTAVPGSYRGSIDGNFGSIGSYGTWWSATENGTNFAWGRSMDYVNSDVYRNGYGKQSGYSVRCLRD